VGSNITDDASCFGLNMPTNMNSTNPQIEPLAYSGGNTLTYAPTDGSPAIDNGSDVACAADPVFAVDQRGPPAAAISVPTSAGLRQRLICSPTALSKCRRSALPRR